MSYCRLKISFLGLKTSLYAQLGYKIFGNKNIPFYGPTESCHFVRVKHHFVAVLLSFCGLKDLIRWVESCHFVGLGMSFCGSKDVILWV